MTETYPGCLPTVGSIGLVKVKGVVGDAIRVAQLLDGDGFRDFEHAFILYGRGESVEESMVVEAETEGVRMVSLAEYKGRKVLWLTCPEDRSTAMMKAAMTYLGVPYSFTDYAAIAAHRLRSPLAKPFEEWVRASHHVICSQLAVACADKAGWGLVGNEWDGWVTPGKLAGLAPKGTKPVLIQ